MAKIIQIFEAIELRLKQITQANGYYTDAGRQVMRGQRTLDHSCLPGVAVWMESRTPVEERKATARVDCTLVMEALADYEFGEGETVALWLISDIQKAVEAGDRTLGGLVLSESGGGLVWRGDNIVYPENSETQVGVQVTYAVPHIRRPGDPTL